MPNEIALSPFQYPATSHSRRHGPSGYVDYSSYKPWLRDEFTFRCVFCLVRERWYPNGDDSFGVDHLIPKSVRDDLSCNYQNLVYSCNRCNSQKHVKIVPDPCAEPMATHLRVNCDGTIKALTKRGQLFISAFNLNFVDAVAFRRQKIEELAHWHENDDSWSISRALAYPEEHALPDLSRLRCDNSRPEGIDDSHLERHRRGELETTY